MHIGFAGLGRMGAPMARNLAAAGHAVLGYDSADVPTLEGVTLTATPADLATSEMSISMLPDGDTTRHLVAALAGAGPDHVHVIMGTIGPDAARAIAGDAVVAVVDAPVSGSVSLAESAAITTMVGGTTEQFERVRPVLDAMTSAQIHTGPVGSGSTAKLAVNAVLSVLSEAVAEGMLVAEAGDLDTTVFYEVLRGSAAGAPYVGYKQAHYLTPDDAGVAAPVSLIRKDLGLALDLARRAGVRLPGSEASYGVLEEATEAGLGEEDMAQVLTALRRHS